MDVPMALMSDIKVEELEIGDGEGFSDLRCRACLSINRQLYFVNNNKELGEEFLKICSFYDDVPLNVYLCWECVSVLRKLVLFKNKVQCAESVLRSQLCDEKHVKSLTTLCISRVINTDASIPIADYEDHLFEAKPKITRSVLKDEDGDTAIDDGLNFEDVFDYDDVEDIEDNDVKETILNHLKVEKLKNEKEKEKIKKKPKERTKKNRQYELVDCRDEDLKELIKEVPLNTNEISEWMENERNTKFFKGLKLKCVQCLRKVNQNSTLQKHFKIFHQKSSKRTIPCSICKQYLPSSHMTLHLKKHHFGLECSECGYRCCTHYNMKRHVEEHRKTFQCKHCNAKFGTTKSFFAHFKAFHTIFKCDHCKFKARYKKVLIGHIQRMHTKHRCEECKLVFKTKATYKMHVREKHVIDRSEEAFCVQCNKQFDNVLLFKRHLQNSVPHLGERNVQIKNVVHKCPECLNIYRRKTNMMNHYRYVHSKTSKYYCKECNKYFLNASKLGNHKRRVHENYSPPKDKLCNICGRGFSQRTILINHIRTHTGERPYECSLCDAKFAQKVALTVHMKFIHLKAKRKQSG